MTMFVTFNDFSHFSAGADEDPKKILNAKTYKIWYLNKYSNDNVSGINILTIGVLAILELRFFFFNIYILMIIAWAKSIRTMTISIHAIYYTSLNISNSIDFVPSTRIIFSEPLKRFFCSLLQYYRYVLRFYDVILCVFNLLRICPFNV